MQKNPIKIGLEIKILNFGFWPLFDPLYLINGKSNIKSIKFFNT